MAKIENGRSSVQTDADYIIVGAGSAGCVLADRLSASGRHKVLVLEAGADDRPSHNLTDPGQLVSDLNIHVPAGFTRMLKDERVNWNYTTEPDPSTGNRQYAFARGKVLGGSSSINGMLWVRGLPEDYEGWRQLGCDGWDWETVERYFNKIENDLDKGASGGGPVPISDTPCEHPMIDLMIKGFEQAGAPVSDDLNGIMREGVSKPRTNTRRGVRMSSATTYLHPAMKRSNLSVVTRAHASRIIFEGRRAVGVEYVRGGQTIQARAAKEIILSGGTINSPQLLELSGIGNGNLLKNHGIDVIAHSPRVGENLQDHFPSMIRARLKSGTAGFNEISRGTGLLGQMIRYAFSRTGLLTVCGAVITAFMKSDTALDLPDLQFFASPATVDFEALIANGSMSMERQPGMTIGGYAMRPRSRGTIHIKSPDFRDHPSILPNFLSDPADGRPTVAALEIARRIMQTPALKPYFDHELTPGPDVHGFDDLLAFAKAAGSTGYHQVGTCAMGPGSDAVVSPTLTVNGVEGLRVVDASIMPNVVSGNTNAATVVIGEKASDLILAAAN